MVMPSLLTWGIGAAVMVALSVVLRTVANDAREPPKGARSLSSARWWTHCPNRRGKWHAGALLRR
jgi:hypothetical protein